MFVQVPYDANNRPYIYMGGVDGMTPMTEEEYAAWSQSSYGTYAYYAALQDVSLSKQKTSLELNVGRFSVQTWREWKRSTILTHDNMRQFCCHG